MNNPPKMQLIAKYRGDYIVMNKEGNYITVHDIEREVWWDAADGEQICLAPDELDKIDRALGY